MQHLLFPIWLIGTVLFATATFAQSSTETDHTQDFNFWIGEWKVYKYGTDTLVGESQITPILGEKAIREQYKSTRGPYMGTSLNTYNSTRDRWEQFWVDNSGLTLHIQGAFRNEQMEMENSGSAELGLVANKIIWKAEEGGTVRQTWMQKNPAGGGWTVVFDGQYRKKE